MEIDALKTVQVTVNATQPKAPAPKASDKPADTGSAPVADTSRTTAVDTDAAPKKQDAGKEEKASAKMLQAAIESANKQLAFANRALHASYHEATSRIHVKVIDTETNEIIREIPPEKTLDLFAKVLEMAGILYDESK
ncbi:MAG: flagellar protein FlaG [Defluviitaleaceae bacterium]|nr:flagellar protein FlaG [Defluviitaleaceae bacterium]MCL2835249.1 flagellar protein FlaG [Defluviitaleaceae bacterium]